MMSKPKRIQRKRIKDWRMPPNTVYVGRGSKWGNPFVPGEPPFSYGGIKIVTIKGALRAYRSYVKDRLYFNRKYINELRGKNLACWCRLDQPCHADYLLKIANQADAGGR